MNLKNVSFLHSAILNKPNPPFSGPIQIMPSYIYKEKKKKKKIMQLRGARPPWALVWVCP